MLERAEAVWTFHEWDYHASSLERELISLNQRVFEAQNDAALFLENYLVAENRIVELSQAEFDGGSPEHLNLRIRGLQDLANRVAQGARIVLNLNL